MFEFCTDPKTLEGLTWFSCYVTTPKHLNLLWSVFVVFGLLAAVVPPVLMLGFAGALARQSRFAPLRLFGLASTSLVRGVPGSALWCIAVLRRMVSMVSLAWKDGSAGTLLG